MSGYAEYSRGRGRLAQPELGIVTSLSVGGAVACAGHAREGPRETREGPARAGGSVLSSPAIA